jgi:hypothetical protein
MANTLGQLIGKVAHSFSITNDNKESVQLTIELDFASASDSQIRSWLASNRTIAGQRVWRAMNIGELRKLNGAVFEATSIGRKVQTDEEKFRTGIAALRAIGMNAQADELEKEWMSSRG